MVRILEEFSEQWINLHMEFESIFWNEWILVSLD